MKRWLTRILWLAAIGTGAYALWTVSTRRQSLDPPEATWPPLDPPDETGEAWVEPNDDGSCPMSHPIKANDSSQIYHPPGGRFYERTQAERCYRSPDAAEADGYRASKA